MLKGDPLPSPLTLSPPSSICDPDGLLSEAGRLAVERVLRGSPQETVFALFRSLSSATERLQVDARGKHAADFAALSRQRILYLLAKALYNSWAIGGRQEGLLYVLTFRDRLHHLYVGEKLVEVMGSAHRQVVLESAVAGLRGGNVDAAMLAVAKSVVWSLTWGARIRRCSSFLFKVLLFGSPVFLLWRWLVARRTLAARKEKARKEREEKLRRAWDRIPRAEDSSGEAPRFAAPCVVCIEPLSQVGEDWSTTLAFHRRGCLQCRSSSTSGDSSADYVALLTRLPPNLQRRVISFLGPALEDFQDGLQQHGRAQACGIELLSCGHVLHGDCADNWLARNNVCPLCRLPDPRITAMAALPAAFAAVQAYRYRHGIGHLALDAADVVGDLVDAVHWVGTSGEAAQVVTAPTYTSFGVGSGSSSSAAYEGSGEVASRVFSAMAGVALNGLSENGEGTSGSW
eukprot:TRINITY_DN80438_c0_g1_i1.p1 TRINITY_DN80438_c0_g1~~TRINITY_DN80438_c0_g1_i1.p1  ORF type:complete len:458 (-),score=78.53 TRINITY_DN80438_c0_g1_i1:48-1421(-)